MKYNYIMRLNNNKFHFCNIIIENTKLKLKKYLF